MSELVALLCLTGAVACEDEAKKGYQYCISLRDEGKLVEARVACDEAKASNAKSPYGKRAQQEVARLDERLAWVEAQLKENERDVERLSQELAHEQDPARRAALQADRNAQVARRRELRRWLGLSPDPIPIKDGCPPGSGDCGLL